jgi:hypothetical protein
MRDSSLGWVRAAVSGVKGTNEWDYILPTAAQSGQSYGNLLDIKSNAVKQVKHTYILSRG